MWNCIGCYIYLVPFGTLVRSSCSNGCRREEIGCYGGGRSSIIRAVRALRRPLLSGGPTKTLSPSPVHYLFCSTPTFDLLSHRVHLPIYQYNTIDFFHDCLQRVISFTYLFSFNFMLRYAGVCLPSTSPSPLKPCVNR